MHFFDINSFTFGVLIGIVSFLTTLLYYLFYRRFKIKVVKVVIFYNLGFSLWKEKIGDSDFILGWFPLGGYVEPDMETKNQNQIGNRNGMFFYKKTIQKILISFSQTIVIVLSVFIYVYFFYSFIKHL
ncbi:MAG: site-2 protease family protein [Bacteroidetes bacterium]|nr:site-2 protease family protein [Bacteroidota bacterium]MCB9043603.1 site-2 protease family protein [Chitinophagales bacterium]